MHNIRSYTFKGGREGGREFLRNTVSRTRTKSRVMPSPTDSTSHAAGASASENGILATLPSLPYHLARIPADLTGPSIGTHTYMHTHTHIHTQQEGRTFVRCQL
jgi:hypothetical protein